MSTLAVIWRTAGLLLATSADSILEVLPPLYCSPTAAVPDWVRGLFTYRGRLIPLVDSALRAQARMGPNDDGLQPNLFHKVHYYLIPKVPLDGIASIKV
jgi:chemotaxis signal transduction protein